MKRNQNKKEREYAKWPQNIKNKGEKIHIKYTIYRSQNDGPPQHTQ